MNWDLSKTMYYHCRYYGGRGYYAAGPANIKNIDYGKTEIKYNVKREAPEESEVKPAPNPYLTALGYFQGKGNIKDIDYGKTGIKYLTKREAEADPEAHYYSYPVYSGYSTGYHFGVPYYGGYYRGYGCRNYLGSIVPCAEA